MMANNYESLKTDGHYTMARRIFLKIKSWAEPKSVPITWANYQALVNAGTDDPNVNYMIIDGISGALLDCFYPVGSYYETSNTSFDPNVSFGGTWVLETEGLVHISSGSNYAVSSNAQDGGNATINLRHSHTLAGYGRALIGRSSSALTTISYKTGGASSAGYKYDCQLATSPGISSVDTTPTDTSALEGGTSTELSSAQSVMQPYKIVNRWHRTA